MTASSPNRTSYDDPRRLRDLLGKAGDLARQHALRSVVVGIAGFEGDLEFPEVVNYVESALRVDDAIFRMTRERAIVLLTDVDRDRAEEIMERLLNDYREHFPSSTGPTVAFGYFEIKPGVVDTSAKEVLLGIFAGPPPSH
ncbi:MAG: hypothetical protein OEM49_05460 [Myxococcales bacterium]|nr:hypothetical protein [Myxococcales bacterium]MDH5307351.1 hypothetical protein [Myxococcales bacterium]MDH5567708.1 hypothetical protein [Myxococcales bacterium]